MVYPNHMMITCRSIKTTACIIIHMQYSYNLSTFFYTLEDWRLVHLQPSPISKGNMIFHQTSIFGHVPAVHLQRIFPLFFPNSSRENSLFSHLLHNGGHSTSVGFFFPRWTPPPSWTAYNPWLSKDCLLRPAQKHWKNQWIMQDHRIP